MNAQPKDLHETLESVYDFDVENEVALQDDVAGSDADPIKPRFEVDDDDKASWALRKLARIQAQIDANDEQAQREMERITLWNAEANGPLRRQADVFETMLTAYHRSRREADPTCKTIKLPAGTLISRAGRDGVDVDAETFLAWAEKEKREDLLRIKTEPDKSAIKEAVLKDGEVLPGVAKVEADVTYKVEVAR